MSPTAAPLRTIWAIGRRGGHEQFNEAWFAAPGTAPPPYVVGRSAAETDWPRFQPGPFNGATAFENCTVSIIFSLDEPPSAAAYELVIDVRALVGSCPHLLVDCNGRRATRQSSAG